MTPLSEAIGAGMGTDAIRTMLVLTLLAVVPAVLVSMTSFIRIVVVLSMVRHAFGMPETPPNIVLVSLALFLTGFTMTPTLDRLNEQAVTPLLNGRISVERAMERGQAPLKDFMLAQTRDSDIEAIYAIAKTPLPARAEEVQLLKLAPAFMLNELRVAFTIGFVVMLPFLLIDLIVASILLALGMMMVPPATISLPIKILMFVLIDGWSLILQGVLGSFR
ncbi:MULTISPECIES: flagellar type III secretion system pore protein FliP [unclassified Sphingomonas]|uniref:flagellar type III secretion system pore protein FliP n=1 Tax=unclassified Sphingomonas TaxID=196159 RepID=UPI0006F4614C|nr:MULTISPECIES: flagellar type III secretion system pore protein FliP [unclassified Sphingomonas]KQM61726.1 flagellar biosynthesis protein flip [Sphingomonas sp. Leaf16]KQN12999.1 flagellar biosynthesis protein flip [Sphingomonas sp. Leaf29]KQN19885.1 flagellar biosynthesis protein flip [Sphingomonas sp. Leaf32]